MYTRGWTAAIFVIISCYHISAEAATYYVDNRLGDDAASGANGAPLMTIRSGVEKLQPGDTLLIVDNGSSEPYREGIRLKNLRDVSIRPATSGVKIYLSGAALEVDKSINVTINDVSVSDSGGSGIMITGSSGIDLNRVESHRSEQAGIKVIGGDGISISDCNVTDAGNNGILFKGNSQDHVNNTLVRDCIIRDIKTNDGITYHKDNKDMSDVGSHHKLIGNVIEGCPEQGIDITSGSDFTLEDNTTSSNGISGIVIGHDARNVTIRGHLSVYDGVNEGGRASYLVKLSSGVSLANSAAVTSGTALDAEDKAEMLEISENTFINISDSQPLNMVLKQGGTPLHIRNNTITSTASSGAPLVWLTGTGEVQMNGNTMWLNRRSNEPLITQKYGEQSGLIESDTRYERPAIIDRLDEINDLINNGRLAELRKLLLPKPLRGPQNFKISTFEH